MRCLIRTRIPTEPGNKLLQDPMTKLEEYINKVKPEASYFMPIDGQRTCAFIVWKAMIRFLLWLNLFFNGWVRM